MPLAPPEHAELADSVSGHVEVEPHLEAEGEREHVGNNRPLSLVVLQILKEGRGGGIYLSFSLRLNGVLFATGLTDRPTVR